MKVIGDDVNGNMSKDDYMIGKLACELCLLSLWWCSKQWNWTEIALISLFIYLCHTLRSLRFSFLWSSHSWAKGDPVCWPTVRCWPQRNEQSPCKHNAAGLKCWASDLVSKRAVLSSFHAIWCGFNKRLIVIWSLSLQRNAGLCSESPGDHKYCRKCPNIFILEWK